jgi:hypothetical protein
MAEQKNRLPEKPGRSEDNIKIDLANGGRCRGNRNFRELLLD